MKRCSVCCVVKPAKLFPRRKASVDGLGYTCKACAVERSRRWRQANVDRHRAYSLAWQRNNKERANARSKAWREKNVARRAEICRAWGKRNQDKRVEAVARRRAKIFTPSWADMEAIAVFYKEAKRIEKETGIKHHVDHIVPLNSDLVCGLHVEHNMRVIPAAENVRKRNLVWPDMP